jgi:tetratricopeptide (TPR) repeat protein
MTALRSFGSAISLLLLVPFVARAQDLAPAPVDLKIEQTGARSIQEQFSFDSLKGDALGTTKKKGEDPQSLTNDYDGSRRLARAESRLWAGNVYGALEDAKHCLIQNPNNLQATRIVAICKAVVALRGNRADKPALQEAAAEIGRLLEIQPDDGLARVVRAVLDADTDGSVNRMIADLTFAIDHGAELQAARLGIIVTAYRAMAFMRIQEYTKAIDDLDRAARICESDKVPPWILAGRGKCHAACDQFDKAIVEFTAAIEQDPQCANYYEERASCYLAKRDYPRALADLDMTIKLRPDDLRVYVHRSSLFCDMGDHARAIAEMDELVALQPKQSESYFWRSVMKMIVLRDWNGALSDVDRAIALEPRYIVYYAVRGFLHGREWKLIPTCKDLTLCAITREQTGIRFDWRIAARAHHSSFSIAIWLKDDAQPQGDRLSDSARDECLNEGISRLLAAMIGGSAS